MNVFVKWIKNHAVSLVCGLLIIVLMCVFFMIVSGIAERNTRIDAFNGFCRKVEERVLDFEVLSDYEIGRRDPEDVEHHDILPTGDIREVRDKVFAVVEQGSCDQHSATYHHIGEFGDYEVKYDTENVGKYAETSGYYCLIGDNICVFMLKED